MPLRPSCSNIWRTLRPVTILHERVQVDEGELEPVGGEAPHGRLTRTHEPYEQEMAHRSAWCRRAR